MKNEKNLSEPRGFLWIYLRHTVTIKEMENCLKQLVLLHLLLECNSATGVRNIGQWESIRKLQRKSVYKDLYFIYKRIKFTARAAQRNL